MANEWVSIYWITPITAWLIAQLVKVVIATLKGGPKESRPTFVSSGSMPSSHSAITVSLLAVIASLEGVYTAAFGIMLVLTSIVIYDALNVRRAVGEQGLVLKKLTNDATFYTSLGHRPLEVIAGSAVGVIVALILLQIL